MVIGDLGALPSIDMDGHSDPIRGQANGGGLLRVLADKYKHFLIKLRAQEKTLNDQFVD